MSRLTANIIREELTCQCGCGFDVADYELVNAIQDSANFFLHRDKADKVAIIITSGNRCKDHNEYIGGAKDSQHIHGKAADYKLKTYVNGEWKFIGAWELSQYLDGKYPNKYGIGIYPKGRVHLDVRPDRARWSKA